MNTITIKSSLVLAVAFVVTLLMQLALIQPAHAATVVWDGGGADSNLATPANWVGDIAPVDGNTLVFDSDVFDYSNHDTVLNNTALTTIAGITLTGANHGDVTITGNDLILTGDITNTATSSTPMNIALDLNVTLGANVSADASFGGITVSRTLNLGAFTLTIPVDAFSDIQSVVSGTGGITADGTVRLHSANTYSGVTSISATARVLAFDGAALGDISGATVVATSSSGSANLTICLGAATSMTIAENITLSGGATNADILVVQFCGFGPTGGDLAVVTKTATFTGAVTISADSTIYNHPVNVVFENLILGANTLTQHFSSIGSLTVNGTMQAPLAMDVQTVAAGDDNAATVVNVLSNQKYIINGVRGNTTVHSGGILSGTGTVGTLWVSPGATLAPGLSPGCLSSGNLTLAGNFNVDIHGPTVCTEYDQTNVTGTVDVTGATLNILRLATYDPSVAGATFIIINNDEADPVVGTFAGLVEGATTVVDGITYTVSYVGGDGNDVTLTVAAPLPGVPDTGFGSVTVNYILIALVTVLATAGMVVAGRKLQKANN